MRRSWRTACKNAGFLVAYCTISGAPPSRIWNAGVSRSVGMRMTGHKAESVYRRYAIAVEGDLREGA